MATDSILIIQAAVAASGIPVTTVGPVVVKRPIAGRSKPSQHSFGNALDYYPSSSDEAERAKRGERVPSLESLYQWLWQRRDTLPIATLCYYRRGGCTTDHLDHLHVDGDPHVDEIVETNPHLSRAIRSAEPLVNATSGAVAVGEGVSSVGDFLGLLTSGEVWVRAGFIVGGFLAAGAGIYFIAREFGAPSVMEVASTATGGVAGAAAKASKA